MDPVTLILAALVAGAAAGVGDAAKAGVKDAYGALKGLVKRRLGGQPSAEVVLAEHERDPQTGEAPLRKVLTEAGADADTELVAAAEKLMATVDPDGAAAGKYTVDLRGAQGVQVGDHNTQTNTYGPSTRAPGT